LFPHGVFAKWRIPTFILIKNINICKKEAKMFYIDTLKTVNQLVDSGFEGKQAKTLVSIFNECLNNQLGRLATKDDSDRTFKECKAEINEVKIEIKKINAEIKTIKWILGIFAGIVVATMVQHNLMH
jgi:hypothetical protein